MTINFTHLARKAGWIWDEGGPHWFKPSPKPFHESGEYFRGSAEELCHARELIPTVVIFRRDRCKDYQVTAVFPELPGTVGENDMVCYAHTGQHSACSLGWYLTRTRPAHPNEYADLKRELESPPYNYRLRIGRRITRAMDEQRLEEIRRMDRAATTHPKS